MITKYSKQREGLIEILKGTDTHPTADALYLQMREKFPSVSLATVYRNLRQLSEQGQILKIDAGTGSEHYDGNPNQHYHFVCEGCGRVYDLDIDVFKELDESVTYKTGFSVARHSLLFYGLCKSCQH